MSLCNNSNLTKDEYLRHFVANSLLTSQRSKIVTNEGKTVLNTFFKSPFEVDEFVDKCELMNSSNDYKEDYYKACRKKSNDMSVVVIGASGASGREIIRLLSRNSKIKRITAITRRILPEWETNPMIKDKLMIIKLENYDSIKELHNLPEIKGYDTFFLCLGTRVGRGEEQFLKVDYEYTVNSAILAKEASIPHFSLLSSQGADLNSWFMY